MLILYAGELQLKDMVIRYGYASWRPVLVFERGRGPPTKKLAILTQNITRKVLVL